MKGPCAWEQNVLGGAQGQNASRANCETAGFANGRYKGLNFDLRIINKILLVYVNAF